MRRWFAGGDLALRLLVGALAVFSAALLGTLAARGSWYADDLDFLIHGNRGFGTHDLLAPVNDHIAPGLRFTYAMFAAVAPLDYSFTVVVRALLWAAAVVLMGALVHRVFGHRPATVIATTTFAFSPLVMPSFMSLSSAVNNLPASVLGLISLHWALDWFESRRWGALGAGALALLGSVLFWEKSALVVATGLALGLMLVAPPQRAPRVGTWLLVQLAALGAFGVFFLSLRGPVGGAAPPLDVLARLTLQSLERSVLPAFTGGPWSWHAGIPPYFGLAAPPLAVVVLGGGVIVTCLAICWRRARPVLWIWAALFVHVAVTVTVVAYGRYAATGETLTMHYHYWSDASVPLGLTVAGTMTAIPRPQGLQRAVPAVLGAAWVIVTVASFTGFAELWGRNPSGAYISRLAAGLHERQVTNLWDTPPPPDVMPLLSNNRQVSGITRLLGADARYQEEGSEPDVVAQDGSIRTARFTPWTAVKVPSDCKLTLHGGEAMTLPLGSALPEGRWYARIDYLANPEVDVRVHLLDANGDSIPLQAGRGPWPAGLTTAYLAAGREGAGSSVVLETPDDVANLCLGSVTLGVVEPAP